MIREWKIKKEKGVGGERGLAWRDATPGHSRSAEIGYLLTLNQVRGSQMNKISIEVILIC